MRRGAIGSIQKLYPAATLPDWIFYREKSILAEAGPGYLFDTALEYPPNPEEEPPAAIITDGAREFDRPEYGVHDNSKPAVHGKIWWFRAQGQFVCLPHFI